MWPSKPATKPAYTVQICINVSAATWDGSQRHPDKALSCSEERKSAECIHSYIYAQCTYCAGDLVYNTMLQPPSLPPASYARLSVYPITGYTNRSGSKSTSHTRKPNQTKRHSHNINYISTAFRTLWSVSSFVSATRREHPMERWEDKATKNNSHKHTHTHTHLFACVAEKSIACTQPKRKTSITRTL